MCNATCRKSVVPVSGTAPFARDSTTSVSVPMAFIIARIAGKPATLRWLAAVAAETHNLHMCIDADVRLAAAAGGVARFLADAAGLESEAVARLQAAVIEACVEAFGHLAAEHPHLEVTFARFPDRLEVSLSHEEATVPGIEVRTIAGFAVKKAPSAGNSEALAGVDRVQHETHGRESVTRLTKYLGEVAPNI